MENGCCRKMDAVSSKSMQKDNVVTGKIFFWKNIGTNKILDTVSNR